MRRNDDVRFISSPSLKLPHSPPPSPPRFDLRSLFSNNSLSQLIDSIKARSQRPQTRSGDSNRPVLCSASLSLTRSGDSAESKSDRSWLVRKSPLLCSASLSLSRSDESTRSGSEERVLISEVLIRNKDGEELERKDLELEALGALKACRANSALTVREVQEDVHRIIDSGYFCQCMPVAIDTRDGIRLIFQVKPNQEFQGLVCEGTNVLPAKFLKDAFYDGYGKVINLKRLNEVITSINDWYMDRGLFAMEVFLSYKFQKLKSITSPYGSLTGRRVMLHLQNMALRSVLGKMGKTVTMTSSKCIYKNGRLVLKLGNFEAETINHKNNNNNKDAPSMDDPLTAYLSEMGCYDEYGILIPMTVNRGIDYHMDLGGIGPAHFAVEEFNKRKKTQLQLVRVQRTWMKPLYHRKCMYRLILDAADATGVVNFYLVYVKIDDLTEGMWLKEFNIFRDSGYPSRLMIPRQLLC